MSETGDMQRRGFDELRFAAQGQQHAVYSRGAGPSVIVLHELPGLAPRCVDFAERLVAAGFRVHLPLLFGQPLEFRPLHWMRQLCVSEEFARLKGGVRAPITDWLRALAHDIAEREGGARIGVVGMCLTAGFVIPMILEPGVGAAVMAQPSVPFSALYRISGLGGSGDWTREINCDDTDLDAAAEAAHRDGKAVLMMRHRADRLCPGARIERLAARFGAAAEVCEVEGVSAWRRIVDPPHALLTEEWAQNEASPEGRAAREAAARTLVFLARHLASG